jgi:MULE transposase-like protein
MIRLRYIILNFLVISFLQKNPDVILIDATYRTNRCNMPLLHFMAVTAVGRTTSIALCFLPAENIKIEVFLTDDEAALKTALSGIFPGVPQLLSLPLAYKPESAIKGSKAVENQYHVRRGE